MNFDYSSFPIREDLLEAHRFAWEQFAHPGTWWSGRERVAIAAEARKSQWGTEVPSELQGLLPENALEATRRISADLHHLSKAWYENLLDDEFTDGHYVEIVSICSILANIDRFYYLLGLPLEPLPEPVQGEPTRYRPEAAALSDNAWVPMISAMAALDSPEADLYDGAKWTATVITAQSLVPDAVRLLHFVQNRHYVLHVNGALDMGEGGRTISREQIEYVAGRVSAFNECFY